VNLEAAASKALSDVKNLITDFGAGFKAFEDLEDQIKKVSQEIHADWPQTLEKAKHLLDDIKKQQHDLDDEAHHADQILKDVQHKLDAAHHDAQDALHQTHQGVQELEQHVHGLEPDVAQVLSHAEDTGHSLRDGANHIHDEFHHKVQDVGHYMENDAVSGIKQSESHVGDHTHEYHDHVQSSVMPEIQSKHEDCHHHMEEHHNQLEEKLNQLHQQQHEHTTQSMNDCHEKHSQVFQDFTQIGEQAQHIMDALSKAVDAGGTAIHEGSEVIGATCDSLGIGLKLCIDIFKDISDMFKHFAFLGL
jgi:DNA repair exonuclease SbcCD ATPase subunit